jgi:hypothetical protein
LHAPRVEAVIAAAGIVEDPARIDALGDQFGLRGDDVVNDEVDELRRTWRRGRKPGADQDRAGRARRCELQDPAAARGRDIGVNAPSKLAVESEGAVNVRHREDDGFEFHVDACHDRFSRLR